MASIVIEEWINEATQALLAAQLADGGWPYVEGQQAATEPTALALLALSSLDVEPDPVAVDWLEARQNDNGFFDVSPTGPSNSWLTPLAGMAMAEQGRAAAAGSAAQAVSTGRVLTILPIFVREVVYDPSIPGWPWTDGDFSMTEPTALSAIFLKRQGQGASGRVRDAIRLLHDREISGGGWNYGEPEVLRGPLFPTVLSTALALLALADEPGGHTERGLAWLRSQRGTISSLLSLGWATIALNVWNLLDDDWRMDVTTRWQVLPIARRDPLGTALCLLGLAPRDAHPLAVE